MISAFVMKGLKKSYNNIFAKQHSQIEQNLMFPAVTFSRFKFKDGSFPNISTFWDFLQKSHSRIITCTKKEDIYK